MGTKGRSLAVPVELEVVVMEAVVGAVETEEEGDIRGTTSRAQVA